MKKLLAIATLGLFSIGVHGAPQVNPAPIGSPAADVCIFHLSSGELDTYATTNCTVNYADGSTSAFATFYGYIPDMTPGYFAYLSKWSIDGKPDCIVISNGVAYTSNNYWNIVKAQPYGLQWTQLTLNCVNLQEFQPE